MASIVRLDYLEPADKDDNTIRITGNLVVEGGSLTSGGIINLGEQGPQGIQGETGPTGSLGEITGFNSADLTDPNDLVLPVQSETSSITFKTSIEEIIDKSVEKITEQENTFSEKQTIDNDFDVLGNLQVGDNLNVNGDLKNNNKKINDFFTVTVLETDFTQTSGSDPFIAIVTVNGLLSTDNPIVDIDLSNVPFEDVTLYQNDWFSVYRVEASDDNELKLYSFEEPTRALDLLIKVVR